MDEINISRAKELDVLKLIYYEVLEGSSFDVDTGYYIKHFSEKENHFLLQKKQELIQFYEKEGIPSQDELLKTAISNGEWTEEKENEILGLRYIISDNEKSILNLIIQQRQGIETILQQKRKDLSTLLYERQLILGKSKEILADEDANDYAAFLSFFKDEGCKENITATYEDYQNQAPDVIEKLNIALSRHCQRINEESIQIISCLPLFLNKFSYCKENIYYFLGKPISQLTYHQNYLLSLGSRNLTVQSQSKGNPPDIALCASLDEVVKWYNREYSLMISKSN